MAIPRLLLMVFTGTMITGCSTQTDDPPLPLIVQSSTSHSTESPSLPDEWWCFAESDESAIELSLAVASPQHDRSVTFPFRLALCSKHPDTVRSQPSSCVSADNSILGTGFNGCITLGTTRPSSAVADLDLSWDEENGRTIDCKESVVVRFAPGFHAITRCGVSVTGKLSSPEDGLTSR